MTDREILRELLEAFDAPFPAANFGMTAQQEWAMRIESAKKTGFAAIAATQPVKQHSDYHRTLAKWLNEETTAPIDRVALAHVLGAAAQAPPVIAPALAAPQPSLSRKHQPRSLITGLAGAWSQPCKLSCLLLAQSSTPHHSQQGC